VANGGRNSGNAQAKEAEAVRFGMLGPFHRAAGCLVLVLSLAGCAHRYSPPELRPADAVFPGLWDALAANGEADMLYVHGICHHTRADAQAVFEKIAEPLALDAQMEAQGEPIGPHGGLLFRGKMRGQGRTVNLFAIVWSPISDAPKARALCFDVVGGNAVCPATDGSATGHRALVNSRLKDGLLNECLSDAVFYAGEPGRDAIGEAVREALMRTLSRRAGEDRPLLVYTESLGSKILFDALGDPRNWATAAFMGWYQRPVQVFMGANQLPLLSLATDPKLQAAGAAQPSLSSAQVEVNRIARLVAGTRPLVPRPQAEGGRRVVVAFDDPNDLLGYTLRPYGPAHPEVTFIDVLVSNAPDYAGFIELPLAAHTGYRRNPDVQRMIACGSRALAGGCPREIPALR
jgi:hypothetical protein